MWLVNSIQWNDWWDRPRPLKKHPDWWEGENKHENQKNKRNGVAMRQQHGALYTSKHNNNNN